MASEGSPSRGGEDSSHLIRIGRSVQIVIEKKSNLTGREKGTNRAGSSMRRCSVLRERRERLGREHAGHALDLRHEGLEEVLAGVRADAGHDVLVSSRAGTQSIVLATLWLVRWLAGLHSRWSVH